MATTSVSLFGTIVGQIWMPNAECSKVVKLAESDFRYHDNSRPTLRDFALKATNDGDFQSCNLTADSEITFERTRQTASGKVTRTRTIPVSQFPSIADCIDQRESWEFSSSDDDE